MPVFAVPDACDLDQTEKDNSAVVTQRECVKSHILSTTLKARRIMKTCTAIVTVFGILMVGVGLATADKQEHPETVESLITTVVEAEDETVRKKAVELLVKRDNTSTPLVIDALKTSRSLPAKEALVYVLSHKNDERTKKVLFEVLKDTTFSPKAKEWAVYGLSELTRVVNRSSVEPLKQLYKLQESERVKTKLRELVTELEPLPRKPNKLAKDPSSAEIHKGLQRWARSHPDIMDVETRGKSVLGKPILLVKITDEKTSDENKSVVLFTSTHCGNEELGTTSLLHLTKWLLGKGEGIENIRKQVVVLIMPCVNPDGWDAHRRTGRSYYSKRSKGYTALNVYGINIYDSKYLFGPDAAEENPEGMAILNVVEEYKPDAAADVHSGQRGVMVAEHSGFSWSDFNAHSFQPLIVEEMCQALENAGFLAFRPAMDSGRIKLGSRIEGQEHDYVRIGNYKQTMTTFYYRRYHTLAYTWETGADLAVVARARRLLEIGTETWRNEFFPGYPGNQVGRWDHVSISAWGDTASKRRKSRVELWRKVNQFHFGSVVRHVSPTTKVGRLMGVCATTTKASEKWIGNGTKKVLLARAAGLKHVNFSQVAEFAQGVPMAVTSPPHYSLGYKTGVVSDEPVKYGMSIRLWVQYKDAEIIEVCVDGHQVNQSEVDGYMVRRGPGTIVQFNIPPSKVREVHFVSVAYKVGTVHKQGFDQESDWDFKAN